MATLTVAKELLEDMLFGFADKPVKIQGIEFDPVSGTARVAIDGEDIPVSSGVIAIFHVQQNRAGQKLTRMTFQPVN